MSDRRTWLDRLLSGVWIAAIIILTITFSIGLPIYVRPFYYIQIDLLDMPESTGYDYGVIKDAYDEVLDYLTVGGKEFGTGELKYSESGASHFADCKMLFDLNAWGFILSLSTICFLYLFKKCRFFTPCRPLGLGLGFWSGAGTLSVIALLGVLVSIDFNTAFVVFHSIFFPGKDNWIFNSSKDEIIRVMPQQFFMNCAILIGASILIISAALIVAGVLRRQRSIRQLKAE